MKTTISQLSMVTLTIGISMVIAYITMPSAHARRDDWVNCQECKSSGCAVEPVRELTQYATDVQRCCDTDHDHLWHCSTVKQHTWELDSGGYCFTYECSNARNPGGMCLVAIDSNPDPSPSPVVGNE